jgi:hypothetical protein
MTGTDDEEPVVFAHGACFVCGRPFAFNPFRVPSFPWQGRREPICQGCVDDVNPARVARGLPPIVPLPGAYEPASADEWNHGGDDT